MNHHAHAVTEVEQPLALKRRPQFHGMPVPFTTAVDASGTPDFKATDERRWRRVVSENRCALCGERNGACLWFIGGPKCAQHGLFFDAAMHLECALYAAQACPFIAGVKGYNAKHKATDIEGAVRPENMFMLLAARYGIVATDEGDLLIHARGLYDGGLAAMEIPVPMDARWLSAECDQMEVDMRSEFHKRRKTMTEATP